LLLVDLQAVHQFVVRQRFTLMVNRYDVSAVRPEGTPGEPVCFVEQKRMTFREEVSFNDPESGTPLFRFKARSVMDLGATYDVTAPDGSSLGTFRKDFARSLLRSTWHLEQPGRPAVVGQERSLVIALLRGVQDAIPLPFHFEFAADGQPIMTCERRWGLRDSYLLSVHADGLDRRLAIAMAVGLDALQSR
jgi:uncharacterized protein YxjI